MKKRGLWECNMPYTVAATASHRHTACVVGTKTKNSPNDCVVRIEQNEQNTNDRNWSDQSVRIVNWDTNKLHRISIGLKYIYIWYDSNGVHSQFSLYSLSLSLLYSIILLFVPQSHAIYECVCCHRRWLRCWCYLFAIFVLLFTEYDYYGLALIGMMSV